MMRDSSPPAVERPGLEDVAEEEDVFAAEGSSESPLQPGRICQGAREKEVKRTHVGERGQLSVSQMEAEFVQLTFRKQVSYRRNRSMALLFRPAKPGGALVWVCLPRHWFSPDAPRWAYLRSVLSSAGAPVGSLVSTGQRRHSIIEVGLTSEAEGGSGRGTERADGVITRGRRGYKPHHARGGIQRGMALRYRRPSRIKSIESHLFGSSLLLASVVQMGREVKEDEEEDTSSCSESDGEEGSEERDMSLRTTHWYLTQADIMENIKPRPLLRPLAALDETPPTPSRLRLWGLRTSSSVDREDETDQDLHDQPQPGSASLCGAELRGGGCSNKQGPLWLHSPEKHLFTTRGAEGTIYYDPYLETWENFLTYEAAQYGDHIWYETNASGDYCYVGEQHCIARALQKSVSRRKCAACKIVAHTICIEQLEKINFRCKPSFRESGSRNIREPALVRHHWVHRRRQEGKCKQCGKGFQQKFAFHSKDIVAISCSWCKQAVSVWKGTELHYSTDYHNKVSCFMLQQIEEACPIGAHAALISSMKSSKKKKRTSFKRKSSKKGAETHPFTADETSAGVCKPQKWREPAHPAISMNWSMNRLTCHPVSQAFSSPLHCEQILGQFSPRLPTLIGFLCSTGH
ncbi:hypothetical protein F7725_009347 [Dissostichus mawsoni]|uniref:Phorbol-ester/DAG-type domain-containing protein n=1 Tax=Dissostichus mawsoni TaxID=36200 RepID=A0A7J5ZAV1_DISMA|nr:hypothetical protein F7725_009347 [Dissostichus mawsoni]